MKRPLVNCACGAIWGIWVIGGIWAFMAASPMLQGGGGLSAKAQPPAAAPLLAKGIPDAGAVGQQATSQVSPLIAKSIEDCTALTPIDKSAGTACDAKSPKPTGMAPALFHAPASGSN